MTTASTTTAMTTATTSNALTVLAKAATSVAQLSITRETASVNTQIQNRLTKQIAALQPATDTAVSNATAAQLTALQTQQSQIEALSPQWGANANVLSSLQNDLGDLQTAAANGDSATFDATLSNANTALSDLAVINAPAPFQADGVAGLQGSGLGILSSAQYDLSSPAGQAAAEAAISTTQNTLGQIFAVTTANQLLGTDLTNSLSTSINQVSTQQQQQQDASQSAVQAQITRLTQQAQDQEHLIELALGNTTTLANSIFATENPPAATTSPLEALEEAVGATATSSTAAANNSPPILSLLG